LMKTSSPRKRNAFDSEQNSGCALLTPHRTGYQNSGCALLTPHRTGYQQLAPPCRVHIPAQRTRGSGTLGRRARAWPPKLRAPSFPRFLGHVTRPRFRSFGGQVAAAQVGLQLVLLLLPLGCALPAAEWFLTFRPSPRTAVYLVVGARYTGYTCPPGYLKR
jgi:hypothetical protein